MVPDCIQISPARLGVMMRLLRRVPEVVQEGTADSPDQSRRSFPEYDPARTMARLEESRASICRPAASCIRQPPLDLYTVRSPRGDHLVP